MLSVPPLPVRVTLFCCWCCSCRRVETIYIYVRYYFCRSDHPSKGLKLFRVAPYHNKPFVKNTACTRLMPPSAYTIIRSCVGMSIYTLGFRPEAHVHCRGVLYCTWSCSTFRVWTLTFPRAVEPLWKGGLVK